MCRLLGEYRLKGTLTDMDRFNTLALLSKKGGPDDTSFYRDNVVQFGFNRLAILDLSEHGKQPMISPSGRYVVVFNGEIYNHLTLKQQLQKYTEFKGTSDTETITHCFDEWGIEFTVEKLDGMFAIAVFDKEVQSVSLIRDFAGIKPIYFGLNKYGLVFSSQFDQVAKHDWFKYETIDADVLSIYLKMHYIPAPLSLLTNTHQVLPGEIVKVDREGSIHRKRYWELPLNAESSIEQEEEALALIGKELNESVNSQLASDVPLGAFLSGGIDSALICNYANKNFKGQLNTFTIGSESKKHDESEDALKVAGMLDSMSHVKYMSSKEALNVFDEALNSLTEPLADISILPTYLVCKEARKVMTVALSGDGGDELFFGYDRYRSVLKNHKQVELPYLLKYLMYGTDKVIFNNRHINSGILFKKSSSAHQHLHSRFAEDKLQKVFPDSFNHELDGFGVYHYPNTKSSDELLKSMRYAEFYGMMQKTLRKVDRASMGVGLEVRVPYLSKSFIEASLKVSPRLGYGDGRKKLILKQLLKNQLSQVKISDEKKGFSIPLRQYINQDLKEYFNDILSTQSYIDKFGFNKSGINTLLEEHYTNKSDNKWALFTILSLFKWQEQIEK